MRRCRPALGTYVEIDIAAASDDAAGFDAIDRAFAAIDRVDALMSFHRETSELSRINRSRAGARIALDLWTVEVLALAVDLHDATDGLFDCAVGHALIATGLLPGRASSQPGGSIGDLEIVGVHHVRLWREMSLDLGGIAKGYAVDRAVEALIESGIGGGSVNAGGDLRVFGPAARTIHVPVPDAPGRLVEAGRLADGAIATSSSRHTGGWHAGRWRSALIDPRTQHSPPDARRSYSVLAGRCAVADALTKPLALAGGLTAECRRRYGATAFVL